MNLRLLHLNLRLWHFTHETHVNLKGRALVDLRFNFQLAPHFLQQLSADGEAKSAAVGVLLGLNVNFLEINK